MPCSSARFQSTCTWEIVAFGGWIYSPDYLPTGEELFATGAGSNSGSYSDQKANSLIKLTRLQPARPISRQWENYLQGSPGHLATEPGR